jgi:hypothetical protein
LPERGEPIPADMLREVPGEQGRVVVAEIGRQPGQSAKGFAAPKSERDQEEDFAVRGSPDDDRRRDRLVRGDVLHPRRLPVVCLEDGAVGFALEGAPVLLETGKVAGEGKLDRSRSRHHRGRRFRQGSEIVADVLFGQRRRAL